LNQVFDSIMEEYISICATTGSQELEQSYDTTQLEATIEQVAFQLDIEEDIFLHVDIYVYLDMHHANKDLEGEYFYVG